MKMIVYLHKHTFHICLIFTLLLFLRMDQQV